MHVRHVKRRSLFDFRILRAESLLIIITKVKNKKLKIPLFTRVFTLP